MLSEREDCVLLGMEAVQILLKYGAKPVFDDLMEVCRHPDLVRLLLEGKGDPNLTMVMGPNKRSLVSLFELFDAHPDSIEILKEFGSVPVEDDDDDKWSVY